MRANNIIQREILSHSGKTLELNISYSTRKRRLAYVRILSVINMQYRREIQVAYVRSCYNVLKLQTTCFYVSVYEHSYIMYTI